MCEINPEDVIETLQAKKLHAEKNNLLNKATKNSMDGKGQAEKEGLLGLGQLRG